MRFRGLVQAERILGHSLNEPSAMSESAAAAVEAPFRTFMCVVCGFLYHEAEGWPADGISAGTRWEDVPETWTCPDCGVTKSDFEMIEI